VAEKNKHITTFFLILVGSAFSLILLFQAFFTPPRANGSFTTPNLAQVISISGSAYSDSGQTINSGTNQIVLPQPGSAIQSPATSYPSQTATLTQAAAQISAPAFSIAQSNQFPQLSVQSNYLGSLIDRNNLDYGPSVMTDGISFKMWWCGTVANFNGRAIYYSSSNDSANWAAPQVVLGPSQSAADASMTCDPSVVIVGNYFAMYYTGDSSNGLNNSIFVAVSTDGAKWGKYPSNTNPQPLITAVQDGNYGVGQSSLVIRNDTMFHYFTNLTSANNYGTYLAVSKDGVSFYSVNHGQPVFSAPVGTDRDVKYIQSLGVFFMVYSDPTSGKIFWTASYDGINWMPHDNSRTIQTKKACNFDPAMLSFPDGSTTPVTEVFYAATDVDPTTQNCFNVLNAKSSTIDLTILNISQMVSSSLPNNSSINTVQNISTPGNFKIINFNCDKTNSGYDCGLDFDNTLNQNAIVLFLFSDINGNIVGSSIPITSLGYSRVDALFVCGQTQGNVMQTQGNVLVSWKMYGQSDTSLSNPLMWSKSDEIQLINCSGSSIYNRAT